MSAKKTLYLARHAKSSWQSGATNDYDRPLSTRGIRDANKVGQFLTEHNWRPDRIISSPALRAKQTCELYNEAFGLGAHQIHWDKQFYAAYMVTLLHALSGLPEHINSIMLIGHNPSMEDALRHFTSASQQQQYTQKNGKLLTTANVAKLSIQTEWPHILLNEAELTMICRPKSL